MGGKCSMNVGNERTYKTLVRTSGGKSTVWRIVLKWISMWG